VASRCAIDITLGLKSGRTGGDSKKRNEYRKYRQNLIYLDDARLHHLMTH